MRTFDSILVAVLRLPAVFPRQVDRYPVVHRGIHGAWQQRPPLQLLPRHAVVVVAIGRVVHPMHQDDDRPLVTWLPDGQAAVREVVQDRLVVALPPVEDRVLAIGQH